MSRPGEIIVGLDIGTTKTAVVVGEVKASGINIIGYGSHPSDGLRKGMVINIDRTVNSIIQAVTEAENEAKCEISNIYTGISGNHVKGFNSHGIIAIKGKEITASAIKSVIAAAKAIAIPNDREIINVIPQEYSVDDQHGIKDPLGMVGVRLQAKVHIITAARSSLLNIIKCCNTAGLQVADVALQQIASAEAILTGEEKELGAVVVDIGGGTTDIVLYYSGNIIHTAVLPIGGNHITNDIAIGLRTTTSQAENIKKEFGWATTPSTPFPDSIQIGPVGTKGKKQIPLSQLLLIIEPRVEELFELIKKEIDRTNLSNLLGAGVILTGGTSLLRDICKAGEDILDLPVRQSYPTPNSINSREIESPEWSTAVGLAILGAKSTEKNLRLLDKGSFSKIVNSFKIWFEQVF